MNPAAILSRIDAALDAGNFPALEDCARELEAAIHGLKGDAASLTALRAQAVRLSRRLDSAASGVRAARWRLSEIRSMGQAGERLVTYDGQGKRHDTGANTLLTRRL